MDEEIKKEESFEEQPQVKKPSRLKDPEFRGKLYKVAFVLLLLGLAIFTVLRLWDDSHFVDTFYEIDDNKIDGPIRIIQLSDLHLKEFGEDNRDLVNEIIRLKPDLIAMTGDMLDMDATDFSVLLTLCRQLVDVAPVFFCYGNHEKEVIRVNQTSTINVDLENMGVHVLHNRYETINIKGNLIDIGGLSANPGTFDVDYTQTFWDKYIKKENYKLLLVHYPQFFYPNGELYGSNIDMALCGHLHGGVVVIPGKGGVYHPTAGYFPELSDGATLVNDTWVIVSRGLGGSPRVNNPPELVIIDIY